MLISINIPKDSKYLLIFMVLNFGLDYIQNQFYLDNLQFLNSLSFLFLFFFIFEKKIYRKKTIKKKKVPLITII